MKKIIFGLVVVIVGLVWSQTAMATNGDLLEGIGATSEALGGTGVAAPQDAISALVNNPAALSVVPAAGGQELTFGVTFFQPSVDARIKTPGPDYQGRSDDPLMLVPYLGYARAVTDRLTLGLGAYGVSGMGVDYRNKGWDLDGNLDNGAEGDLYSKFSVLKVAAAAAYELGGGLSAGLALHGNYTTLDLGQGNTDDYVLGAAFGLSYSIGDVLLGASYTLPHEANFKRVFNFDSFLGDTEQDNLKLEQPAIYAVGIAWQASSAWLLEFNFKQVAWSSATGYDAFDWRDQQVYAIGAQYRANDKLTLRGGFNYARNPVREHHGWNPAGATEIQGKQAPTLGYELLRNVGFPAIVESHLTAGFGYKLKENLDLNVAYAHVFKKTIRSQSAADVFLLESGLSEDSLTVGLTWRFE